MKKIWKFILAPPAAVLIIGLFGWLIESLWNWLLPPIFGLHTISFWQALGLFLLSRILFGGWGGDRGHHHRHGCRRGPEDRRGPFTPEERERFRREWRERSKEFDEGFGEEPPENKPA